ncbi:MAG: histidinol dehydrogenase, partial [Deltaproteobacteria bacterium]|nr:histidinol dehydrogenase [Deltaproteobacteria bacterium]
MYGETKVLTVKKIDDLSTDELKAILTRSAEDISQVCDQVRATVEEVRARGDDCILEHYAKHKPDIGPADLVASPEEIKAAYAALSPQAVAALKKARQNIVRFHEAQKERAMWSLEVQPGVLLGRMTTALEAAGCYAPGGTALYPSSVLMTVLPARVAGVDKVVVVSPPQKGMVANPAVLVAADIAGADMVVKVGGPWAVAGLAYGTATIPQVDKIVGPGNKYVTAAKLIVFGQVDIDSPAGPSESLILADRTANPRHMALDFLSQVEHDPDSGAVLVTDSARLAQEVCRLVADIKPGLDRQEQLDSALSRHSHVLVARDMDQALDLTNSYAPEHLQIVTADPWALLPRIRHAGSIFLGPFAPVPVGDYVSGTNHVLPTGQMARIFSGLSIDDFLKKPTFQYLSQ